MNSGYWTDFEWGCQIFNDKKKSVQQKITEYFALIDQTDPGVCHKFKNEEELPDLWNAVCCYLLPMLGVSENSIWPADPYVLEDDLETCHKDYGIEADPEYLDKEFGLNDLTGVTRILMTGRCCC